MTPDDSRRREGDDRSSRDEQWLDLVATQLATGLSGDERQLFEGLAAEHSDDREQIWEQLAGSVALACAIERYEPLPERLRDRLRREAVSRDAIGAAAFRGTTAAVREDHGDVHDGRLARVNGERHGRTGEFRSHGTLGWLAAAVCLAVAVLGQGQAWNTARPLAPLAARARLIARGEPALVRASWTATEDVAVVGDKAALGDVVFDPSTQEGYMRFQGLAANDPGREQYQLWIFDARQDERYPVDGGVFDIPAGAGEVVVPIRAAIEAREPVMFAITVEKPGGVVVSSRERLPLLATLE